MAIKSVSIRIEEEMLKKTRPMRTNICRVVIARQLEAAANGTQALCKITEAFNILLYNRAYKSVSSKAHCIRETRR